MRCKCGENVERRGWWEEWGGSMRGQCRHGRAHPGSSKRREADSGPGSGNSGAHPWKTQNDRRVEGTPGEGGVPKAMGQTVVRKKGPHGWVLEKPTGMGQKKAYWLQQHGGRWVGLADIRSRLDWVRRRGKKGDKER